MGKTTEQRLAEVFDRAMTRWGAIYAGQWSERQQCIDDRRFYSIAGAMWEGDLGQQFENLPKFEVNKILLAVIRIFNEFRNNRVSVDFRPTDGDDDTADTLDGLYRADEQECNAQEAYDNAFEEGVGGGFGAWRLRAEYEDEEDEDSACQRIRLEPIPDADSCVFFPNDAKRYDKRDATHCFVLTGYSREDFEAEWPDENPATWERMTDSDQFDWATSDTVYVAEYYEVEEGGEKLYFYTALDGTERKVREAEYQPDLIAQLEATGFKLTRTKKIKRPRVRKYLLSGGGVLSDEGIIAGTRIPIVPFYGKRWFIDGIERCMGHVRPAKDPQRLKNMQISRLGQLAALSPIEKPILFPEQIAGHTVLWSEDNIKNNPYLLINPMLGPDGTPVPTGPVAYTKPPTVPAAMAALLQISETDIQDVLGNQQAAEKLQANVSAKAVNLVKNALDMQTFIYMDNFAKSMKISGEIWHGMARDLYIEEGREMQTIGERGEEGHTTLMQPNAEAKGQVANNIADSKMKVVVDVGPSFMNKRDATVAALTGMMQVTGAADPELTGLLASTAVMNMDGEGLKDLRDYLRKKMLRKGVIKPSEQEAQELAQEAQQTPPDPQAQYLQAAAAQAAAMGQKAQADTVLTLAKVEQSKADTAKTLASIDDTQRKGVIETLDAIQRHEQPAVQPVIQNT